MSDDDCMECGACCFSNSETYVEVNAAETDALERLGAGVTRSQDGRRYLAMAAGRCGALQRFGDAESAGFRCIAYAARPAPCRRLVRGSPECLAERAEKLRVAKRHLRLRSGPTTP